MIRYEIDLTEEEYRTLEGEAADAQALRQILTENGSFPDCMGYIRTDAAPDASLCIAAVREYGISLSVEDADGECRIALSDSTQMHETVDVWGDGLEVSKGLFFPAETAWEGIAAFAEQGICTEQMQWISPEEIPEDGNYII